MSSDTKAVPGTLVTKLRKASRAVYLTTEKVVAPQLSELLMSAAGEIERLEAEVTTWRIVDWDSVTVENKRLEQKCNSLEQEATIQAQEMRTQRSSLRECYQAVTGSTGEPGDWNGANPVKEKIEELGQFITRLSEELEYVMMTREVECVSPCCGAMSVDPHCAYHRAKRVLKEAKGP